MSKPMTPEERADQLCARLYPGVRYFGAAEPPALIASVIRAAVAAEREACAKAVESQATAETAARRADHEADPNKADRYWLGWDDGLEDAAAASRPRGEAAPLEPKRYVGAGCTVQVYVRDGEQPKCPGCKAADVGINRGWD